MLDTWWLALITGGIGCIWIYRQWKTFSILPPGPKGWPLVGNAFQQDPGRTHLTWSKWAQKFGEIFTINSFGTPIVVCNSSKAIWEMLVTKSSDFAHRPDLYPTAYITDGRRSVAFGGFDSHWAYRKRVFSSNVKMYGDGLERLENIMLDVVTDLVEDIKKTNQQPFDPMKPIQLALCNTLALLLFGDKFEIDDPKFEQLIGYVQQFDDIVHPSLDLFLLSACPWLHYVPLPYCRTMDNFVNGFMKEWIPKAIEKRMTQYDAENIGCILDGFIKQHETDMKTGTPDALEMRHIVVLCFDVFIGGNITSPAAMYTMMSLLTINQDVQTKVREEVDQVLGSRRPKLQDRQSMPYFQAMVEEIFRFAVILNGFAHEATVDSSICGHYIPKGTKVWANVWNVSYDPEVYEDPWTFKPERFLDDNGNFLPPDHPRRKNVLSFSAGKRVCPGGQLAKNRIFLITTSLLQNFVFKLADGCPQPQGQPSTYPPGFVIKPHPYKIRAIPRD